MAPDWRWILARSQDMKELHELTHATGRNLQLGLNKPGSASFSIDLEAPEAIDIIPIYTCLICYRNAVPIWSGPIWTVNESLSATSRKADVAAIGWFELFNHRLLKCGPSAPGGATTTATTNSYVDIDQATITIDLINRTNSEHQTGITIGNVDYSVLRTITYNRFQNIGQEILNLTNIEDGFDFDIDPLTREFNIWHSLVKTGSSIFGKGQDRPKTIFTWGRNLSDYARTVDGSKLMNQMTALGKFGLATQDDLDSQEAFGLFEESSSLTEVVDPLILEAFAAAEVAVRGQPQVIHAFTPKTVQSKIDLQPFVDYDLGDICYLNVDFGRTQTASGTESILPDSDVVLDHPQAVRIFAFNVAVDESGTEKISQLQTNASGG